MEDKPMESKVQLTDPRALRAYAHPTRMSLVGLLRREGPFTATRAAELTGESVASCSYHLRILAKYGLVEEAPPGPGREKPWRATAEFTSWPGYSEDTAVASAAEALTVAVAENYFHRMTRAIETRGALPRKWQEAERFTDTSLYVTPDELTALGEEIDALLARYADRINDPARRPEGARRVPYLQIGYVDPERPERPEDGRPPEPDPEER
ncbi:winged helix-turn-helix domain-containing protein [Streptomyces sp. CBMA29]|uniref:winged helix-turn-helix domain-containing protein n=1 Tax=Streptomyces sp. CBMA29 TaxID=1896314 RepID=UPI001CB73812|nr:helix-turn-helix domain-containing protein [Streptomyces sp. CBMA29]